MTTTITLKGQITYVEGLHECYKATMDAAILASLRELRAAQRDTERLNFLFDWCARFENGKGEYLPEMSREAIDDAIGEGK